MEYLVLVYVLILFVAFCAFSYVLKSRYDDLWDDDHDKKHLNDGRPDWPPK